MGAQTIAVATAAAVVAAANARREQSPNNSFPIIRPVHGLLSSLMQLKPGRRCHLCHRRRRRLGPSCRRGHRRLRRRRRRIRRRRHRCRCRCNRPARSYAVVFCCVLVRQSRWQPGLPPPGGGMGEGERRTVRSQSGHSQVTVRSTVRSQSGLVNYKHFVPGANSIQIYSFSFKNPRMSICVGFCKT